MPAIADRHSLSMPDPYIVPATSLARSNALHSAQKPTVPPTHEIFGQASSNIFCRVLVTPGSGIPT
jgi:hypothetical protein